MTSLTISRLSKAYMTFLALVFAVLGIIKSTFHNTGIGVNFLTRRAINNYVA